MKRWARGGEVFAGSATGVCLAQSEAATAGATRLAAPCRLFLDASTRRCAGGSVAGASLQWGLSLALF